MRVFPVLVLLLVAGAVLAQELSVAEVVAAHRAGAPEEGILGLIREAPAVAPLAPTDLSRLREAGVPERVVQAMLARTAPTPTPGPARPDDARLAEVARTVDSGVSAEVVAAQVRQSGQRYALTLNDLIYLKENNVGDVVILALLASGAAATPVPAVAAAAAPVAAIAAAPGTGSVPPPAPTVAPVPPPKPAEAMTFGPLLRMTGAFRRESRGTLILTSDALEWRDDRGSEHDASLPVASLRGIWLGSVGQGSSRPAAELRVRTVEGNDLSFRDADWASGGATRVEQLYRVLEERYPRVIVREKVAR
jgi:hypothetical protein